MKCCPSCCGGCKIELQLYICNTVLNRIIQSDEWLLTEYAVIRSKQTGTAHEYLDLKCKYTRDLYFASKKLQDEMHEADELDYYDVLMTQSMSTAQTLALEMTRN